MREEARVNGDVHGGHSNRSSVTRGPLPACPAVAPRRHECGLVKDDCLACVICGAELPRTWNVDPLEERRHA